VPRLAGPMAAAFRLTAKAGGARDRTRTKVAELIDLLNNRLTSLFPIGKSMRHKVDLHILAYRIRKVMEPKKEI
jgi:hypothetical protein